MLESFNLGEFKYKRLTEAEQKQRGILGRLVGVIADTNNATRNGRKYGLDLWKHVFDDPIMKEKIANKCIFSELGHPTDREEIDMTKVCACLAEQPKLGADGKLYGVFDILDLPNGKILKALCDYGTTIGVSSRGSGDIMDNDEVDPETYTCECFDIVVVPAVKEARLKYMNEALDRKTIKLKAALRESYNAASDEDKKVMKEALDDLDINIDDGVETLKGGTPVDPDLIPRLEDDRLLEAADEEEVEEAEADEEAESDEEDKAEDEAEEEEVDVYTVGDLIKELKKYDKDSVIDFKPIVIDGVEQAIEMLSFDDSEDGKLAVEFGYGSEMSDNIEDEVKEEPAEVVEPEANEEEVPEDEAKSSEEAVDDGMEEVLESLKEVVRQKENLENEIKNLKNSKTVGDAEVKKLKENLIRYKDAFARTSEIAAEGTSAKAKVQALTETLKLKEKRIKELESVKANTVALTESATTNANKVKNLTEALNSTRKELAAKETALTEQKATLMKQLNESTTAVKSYRTKLAEAVNKYIASKADMLGVRTTEITSRLNDKFSMADIDKVCEKLLQESVNWSNRLPINSSKQVSIKFNEAKSAQKQNLDNGYDIDDSLLELAGLK